MSEYTAVSDGRRKYILTTNDLFVGELEFLKWSVSKANMRLASGEVYEVRPKGFWKRVSQVMKDGQVLATYKFTFSKGTELTWHAGNVPEVFHLRLKGFWKSRYELQDVNKEPQLVITSSFKWKGMKTIYHMQPSVTFESAKGKELLMMLVLCAINEQRRMAAVTAATA